MRTVAALLVAFMVLAGCSDGDDGDADRDPEAGPATDTSEPSETGDTAGDNRSPACELLTTDEVGELFGQPATVVPAEGEVAVTAGSDTCLWEATSGRCSATSPVVKLFVSSASGMPEALMRRSASTISGRT